MNRHVGNLDSLHGLQFMPKLRQNIERMLSDRGYVCVKDKINWPQDLKVDEKAMKQDMPEYQFGAYHPETRDIIYIVYCQETKINIPQTRDFKMAFEQFNMQHIIIINSDHVNANIESSFKSVENLPLRIEYFACAELLHIIVDHKLVPRNEVVPLAEIPHLLKRYKLQHVQQLYHYRTQDPVVKYYGWLPGVVVKVTRLFGGAREPEIVYRVVV
jgi:DNA-directed RNA polymerase subunit H (RpoH/RPB5)